MAGPDTGCRKRATLPDRIRQQKPALIAGDLPADFLCIEPVVDCALHLKLRVRDAFIVVTAHSTQSSLERWFYASMALLFASAAIIGFTPNSIAILAGTKQNPPLLIHIHAVAMSSWLLLLSIQAVLVASGNLRFHKRVGMVSLVLAPIIVVIMISVAFPLFQHDEHTYGRGLIQIKRITLFSIFYVWAFVSRKRDPEAHKRLMFLATLVVLDAAFNRMRWFLPNFGFSNSLAVLHTYELLLLVPLFAYDLAKRGSIHWVYLIGTTMIIAFSIIAATFW
jgi:hypothetical protein